jgi:hypothetical protein
VAKRTLLSDTRAKCEYSDRDVTTGFRPYQSLEDIHFTEGLYYIKLRCDWKNGSENYGLSSYGPGEVKFVEVDRDETI